MKCQYHVQCPNPAIRAFEYVSSLHPDSRTLEFACYIITDIDDYYTEGWSRRQLSPEEFAVTIVHHD